MKLQKIIAAALLLGTVGCKTSEPSQQESVPKEKEEMTSQEFDKWYSQYLDKVHASRQVDLQKCYDKLTEEMLSGEQNTVLSPLNLAISLGMLAEVTDNQSREQLLSLLGQENTEQSREAMKLLWETGNVDNSVFTEKLGASLWVDQDLVLKDDTVNLLQDAYHADVYSGDLHSEEMNQKLQEWTNEKTGNLLKDYVKDLHFEDLTVMEMITTIFYKAGWKDPFTEAGKDVFHSVNKDQEVDYLKAENMYSYIDGDGFQMVSLPLSYSGVMKIILPDGDLSEVLAKPVSTYMNMEMDVSEVDLKLPQFDVSGQLDLIPVLTKLGVKDVFSSQEADFSPLSDMNLFLSKVQHTARVSIDKDGVQGAAYTEMALEAAGVYEIQHVQMQVDRPFLFLIQGEDGSLVFAGTVVNVE